MKEIKKEYNKVWWSSIITSLIFVVIGVLLILKPTEIITVISMMVGIGIIIAGIFAFLRYFRNAEKQSTFRFDVIYGVICVLAGTLLIMNPSAVASILPLVLGVWMIINSIIKIQYALTIKQYNNNSWMSAMIIAIITLACGILFIFNPFKGAAILTQILGAIITLYAVLDIVNSCIIKSKVRGVSEFMQQEFQTVTPITKDEVIVEAKIVEEVKKPTKKIIKKETRTKTSKK